MSYRPPPKTSYGDTDFFDDTGSQQSSPSYGQPPPPPMAPDYGGSPQRQAYRGPMMNSQNQMAYDPAQSANPQYRAANPMQQGQADPNTADRVIPTITAEDMNFIRDFQKDLFYYRVLPIGTVGLGSLYMFNKIKSRPHSIMGYFLVASASYMVGKWSYKDELLRRLMAHQSNTPFMQVMRKSLNMNPIVSSEFTSEFGVPQAGGGGEFDQWNSGEGSNSQPSRLAGDRQFGSGFQPSYESPDRLDNQNSDELTKPRVTYDELRARNRGLSR